MDRKTTLMLLLSSLTLISAIQAVSAASITAASLDRAEYLAGQTGYISVTIYNDESEKIRVTELSATIDYYYADGTKYIQKFFTSATLPDEIAAGQSETYQIPISLPTNLAHGYTNPRVEAYTDVWRPQDDRWTTSDRPTWNTLKLYVQTAYKQMYETSQQTLEEQVATNDSLANTMNLLSITTVIFAAASGFLLFLVFRRPKPIAQA
ncbi:MAG TPA: hypothetical protein VJ249_05025 [Candidatus Bathyarchaeia archaeon]|nr:hypothetical protein [Candidatus Bathyarchaeia archaeon]